ncbi:MAG: helix-turn-helix domain-containing protein [Elainella sp.]
MDMKQLRQNSGLRAEDVATRLDIAVSTVRNWEQGRTLPKLRLDQFVALCELYKCSINDLYSAAQESMAN